MTFGMRSNTELTQNAKDQVQKMTYASPNLIINLYHAVYSNLQSDAQFSVNLFHPHFLGDE